MGESADKSADVELGAAVKKEASPVDEGCYAAPLEMLHTAVNNCDGQLPQIGLFLPGFADQRMEEAFQALQTERRCYVCGVGTAMFAAFIWVAVILDYNHMLSKHEEEGRARLDIGDILYLVMVGVILTLIAAGVGLWWRYGNNRNYKAMYAILNGVYLVFLVQSATTTYLRFHRSNHDVTDHGLMMQAFGLVLVGNMWSVTVLPLWFQLLYILQVSVMVCTSSKADNFMRLVIVFGSISSLGYGYFIARQLRTAFIVQCRLELAHLAAQSAAGAETERAIVKANTMTHLMTATSHDLRTPLSAVLSGCRVLRSSRSSQGTEAMERVLVMMEASNQLCLNFVNGLALGVKALEGNPIVDLKQSVVELDPLIRETIDIIKYSTCLSDAVKIMFSLDEQCAPSININFQALQTILLNLLSNACRHTAEGSVTVTVAQCAPANNKPQVQFSVVDTGCGVPVAHREQLFEPFVSFQGSVGLGLFIVEKQANALGGECGYYPNADSGSAGSVFWIRVPYEPEMQPLPPQSEPSSPNYLPYGILSQIVPYDEGSLQIPAAVNESTPNIDSTQEDSTVVLLIDDVPSVLALHAIDLRCSLKNCTVVTAHGPLEGLELMKQREFTVVFCDVKMPHMDGDSLTVTFREWEAINRPSSGFQHIYALSAYCGADINQRMVDAGMQGVLKKPMQIDEIQRVINAR